MSRYRGPKDKLSRKHGELLSGMPTFEVAKRPYKAGQHGQRRTKLSEYAILLKEKQKLRESYGVITEKQFRRYVDKATRKTGPTGEILMQLLEARLDNVVYRMGFSPTLGASRQLVGHGHIFVNGYKVDIASYHVKPGDKIQVAPKAQKLPIVQDAMKNWIDVLPYLKREKDAVEAEFAEIPSRDQIPVSVNERMIVEYYSR